ncbi:MAG: hypothetical protein J6W76_07340 [Spirochaetales bacterium]|nr:hypothetical protein [Spirochaetales bacterium]
MSNDYADGVSYSDELDDSSNDISIKAPLKTERRKNPMKFRGNVMFGGYYYFAQPNGVRCSDTPHIGHNSYTPLDYTNEGDPMNYHHNDNKGYTIGSSWGGLEGKLFVSYAAIAPFLTMDNPLFSGNNIAVSLDGELTPVTINQAINVKITPIAFLSFLAGCQIGTGWNFFGLFNGIGINDGSCFKGKAQPFYSVCFQSWLRVTFQFDVAALMPAKFKRWTHIQMQAAPQFRYKALLNTESTQSFQYENDRGENLAGWRLEGTFVLGYKIPIIIDEPDNDEMFLTKRRNNNFAILAAMLLVIDRMDLTHANLSPMRDNGFGSDFCYMYFGPTLMFDLPNNMTAMFGVHWTNEKEYTTETVGNIYYQDRVYQDWYVYFSRILIAVGWNF